MSGQYSRHRDVYVCRPAFWKVLSKFEKFLLRSEKVASKFESSHIKSERVPSKFERAPPKLLMFEKVPLKFERVPRRFDKFPQCT